MPFLLTCRLPAKGNYSENGITVLAMGGVGVGMGDRVMALGEMKHFQTFNNNNNNKSLKEILNLQNILVLPQPEVSHD